MKMPSCLAAVAAAALVASCATSPKLDQLVRRNAEARGGVAAIEAVENLRTKVEIIEPAFAVTGDYRARDGAMRIDIYADGARVFSEGVDESGSWQQNGSGAEITETTAEGRAALLHGIEFNLFGLHELPLRGHKLTYAGEELLDGVNYSIIKIALSDGFETYLYLHPDTAMIERRRDVRSLHPDVDATEKLIENQYFEFDQRCGVISPASSRQIDARTGEELQRTKVIRQDCNLSEEALEMGRPADAD